MIRARRCAVAQRLWQRRMVPPDSIRGHASQPQPQQQGQQDQQQSLQHQQRRHPSPLVIRQYSYRKNGQLDTNIYRRATNPGDVFDRTIDKRADIKEGLQDRIQRNVEHLCRALFPRGYPQSVHPGYRRYVELQMLASLASSANCVLSTQALLYAMGLGAGAIPLAAALNWVIKDGIGQIGGIIFASVVNDRFDANPKRWKMVSCVSMDAATLLELLAPLAPQYFLAIASLANIGKNICFLSSSASRAAIHNAFAKGENLADITAKSGSQFIVTSILGTGLGVLLSSTLGHSLLSLGPLYATFSCINITCNYVSLRHVRLNTINMERLELVLRHYVNKGMVPTPTDTSSQERFLSLPLSDDEGPPSAAKSELPPLQVGKPLDHFATPQQLQTIVPLFEQDRYLLNARGRRSDNAAVVHLLFKRDASVEDVLLGFLHAYLARTEAGRRGWGPPPYTWYKLPKLDGGPFDEVLTDVLEVSRRQMTVGNDFLMQLEQAGWLTDAVFLPHSDNRVALGPGYTDGGPTEPPLPSPGAT